MRLIKHLAILLIVIVATGCKTTKPHTQTIEKPSGKWSWTNKALYDNPENSIEMIKAEFTKIKATCVVEQAKVTIPSPSCVQPPKQDCTGKTGFALGFCQTYTPAPKCDYSAVNAANDAKEELFNSCMVMNGWEKVWEDSNAKPYVRKPSKKQMYAVEPNLDFEFEKELVNIKPEDRAKPMVHYAIGIANMYGSKATGEPNYKAANYWLTKAAIKGVTSAEFELGKLYMSDEYGMFDANRAEYWLKKAAWKKECEALIALGVFHSSSNSNNLKPYYAYAVFDVAKFCAKTDVQKDFINFSLSQIEPLIDSLDKRNLVKIYSGTIYEEIFL